MGVCVLWSARTNRICMSLILDDVQALGSVCDGEDVRLAEHVTLGTASLTKSCSLPPSSLALSHPHPSLSLTLIPRSLSPSSLPPSFSPSPLPALFLPLSIDGEREEG